MSCPLLVALLLGSAVGLAEVPSPQHAADQARLFIRKGWYKDAALELETALQSPEGQTSFEIHWLLAQVCWEIRDIGRARDHARIAAGLAPGPEEEAACWQLVQDIDATFGSVRVAGPQDGVRSRLQLELTSTQFDPELSRFINRVTLALTEPIELPAVIWLPSGTYLVNGLAVSVAAAREVPLQLPAAALGARGLASLREPRLELGTGFGVLLGDRVGNLRPAVETEISAIQPIGRLLIGASVGKSFRTFGVEDYSLEPSPEAFSASLGLGTEVLLGGPLAFRPLLSYRFGLLPGVPFDCRESLEGLACAPDLPGDNESDRLYATAPTHAASLQLAVDWRQGGRVNALGLGVRAFMDQLWGAVPGEGRGRREGSSAEVPEDVSITVEDGAFHATAIRLLADVSKAF